MANKGILSLVCILLFNIGIAQIILKEDFEVRDGYEGGTLPPGWTQKFEKDYKSWFFMTGGHWQNPEEAAQGQYNASFIVESPLKERTKLISPSMDLSKMKKPKVTFYLVQKTWWVNGNPYNDELRLFYKKSFLGNWIPVEGGIFTKGIEKWTEVSVYLDSLDLSKTYYLAFEGTTGYGHGTCIDSIVVEEAGFLEKEVSSIIVNQATTTNIASGTVSNPILRIDINTTGNIGVLELDSLKITSLNTNDADISPQGVKLWKSDFDDFINPVLLASGTDFVNGIASFKDLATNLNFGTNFFWITYDVSLNATPENTFDAKVDASSISISGEFYPETEISPAGKRTILQTMVFDNFETNKGWQLEGFQLAKPVAYGGAEGGNTDPASAKSGLFVLQSIDSVHKNLTIRNYPYNLIDREFYAISPTIDCYYFNDVYLNFSRWLNIELWDKAYIDISTDSMKTWTPIWQSYTSFVTDNKWLPQSLDISDKADRKRYVNVRFALGETSSDNSYSGWNIEDFIITANFLNSDVSVSEWIHPQSGCGQISNDSVVVRVVNLAGEPTKGATPIEFSIDGGLTYIRDTIWGVIDIGKDTVFTFTQRIDLTTPGYYNTIARTRAADDEETINDELAGPRLFSIPTYSIPYETDFEDSPDFWEAQSANFSSWQWGNPSGVIINETSSGINAWKTVIDGRYIADDSSYMVSPCFNFSNIYFPVFEFKAIFYLDTVDAGFRLEYSTDEGTTWNIVKNHSYTFNWNWANQTDITILDTKFGDGYGWSGTQNTWQTYRVFLPEEIANKNGVNFRFIFASSETGNRTDGVAIDDIRIYNAPADIGVVSIDSPISSCELSNDEYVTVTLKNYGLDTLFAGKEIVAGIRFQNDSTLLNTFALASNWLPGAAIQYTYTQAVDMFAAQWYNFTCFTALAEDTAFYEVYNDTLVDSVLVYGIPEYELGQDFGSLDTANVILDAGAGFAQYLWSTGSVTQTTNIPNTGKFYVTVTNDSLCTANDSVTVYYSAKDLSCTAILNMNDGCGSAFIDSVEITITLKNNKLHIFSDIIDFGTDNISFGYKINNNATVLENYISTDTLLPDSVMTYTFKTKVDLSKPQEYTITAFTFFDKDIELSNDKSIVTIENWGIPKVDLGAAIIKKTKLDNILLDAGAGFQTYTWQDGSNLQTFEIKQHLSKLYTVTVTDANSCGTSSDSVFVTTYDIGIDSIVSPHTACINSDTALLSFTILNNSNDTLLPNHQVKCSYLFNNVSPLTEETFSLTDTLFPDSTTILSFTNRFDLSEQKTYNFKIIARMVNDINIKNDVIIFDVKTAGYPVADIGFDTILTNKRDTVILDATADRESSYLWNSADAITGSFNLPTNKINKPQTFLYAVTITANGCSIQDSVLVWLKDLTMNDIVLNDQYCELPIDQKITVSLKNNSNDIIKAGDKFRLALAVDQNRIIYDTLVVNTSMFKNSTTTFTFAETVDLSSTGNHKIRCFLASDLDVNNMNDTVIKTVKVIGYPKPDLGFDTIFTNSPDTLVLKVDTIFDTYQWQYNTTGTWVNSSNITNIVDTVKGGAYKINVTYKPSCKGSDSVTIISYDIKMNKLIGLKSSCEPTMKQVVTAEFLNPSISSIPAGSEIEIAYQLDEMTYRDTIVLTENFEYKDTLRYTFADSIDASEPKIYDIKLWCSFKDDFKRLNDTITSDFFSYEIPQPSFGFDTLYTTRPDTITLKTLEDYTSLVWTIGTKTLSAKFLKLTGDTTVTVSVLVSTTYCQNTTSATIINRDLELSAVKSPKSSCKVTEKQPLIITILNKGKEPYPIGTEISATITVNDTLTLNKQVIFNKSLLENETMDINFDNDIDLRFGELFIIKAQIDCNQDFLSYNDSIIDTVGNWGFETVELGVTFIATIRPDTVSFTLPDNYASYLWSDGTTENTFKVPTNQSRYWGVTATDVHGCIEKDSVLVTTGLFAYKAMISDTASCNFEGKLPLEAIFVNNGVDTMYSGTKIGVQYMWKDSVDKHNYAESLSVNLAPQDSVTIVLDTLSLTENGEYNLLFSSYFITNSDTIRYDSSQNFYQYVQPTIMINEGKDTITEGLPFILSATEGYDSYVWSNDSTEASITADKSGWYYVTVASADGCSDTDSVLLMAYNIGLTSIINPIKIICSNSSSEQIIYTIKNFGTDTLRSGYVIPLKFIINGDSFTGNDTVTILQDLAPGAELVDTMKQAIILNSEGSYHLRIWIENLLDIDRTNDTIFKNFDFHKLPTFQLANGVNEINILFSDFISGPDGYESYLWSSGETSQELLVNKTGSYTLTITDEFGCSASDDVTVTVISSTDEILQNSLNIYPKPSVNFVHIDFLNALEKDMNINLYDQTLKQVLQTTVMKAGESFTKIDVSSLNAGVYYLEFSNETTKFLKKITKK
ncbi:MAG: T9SS type A sorting domain-containing protein [Bacteroidales bacterium]|nr:T9SS type A sorting domain-containing protein [Bacteroidales bacterium]